ncbi:MAG TPA: hypothetical protein VIQ31_06145, partial [Phormidium sp.]
MKHFFFWSATALMFINSPLCFGQGQVDNKIQSKLVNQSLTLGVNQQSKQIRYVTDKAKYDDMSAMNVSTMPYISVKRGVNIGTQYLNPLKFSLTITETDLTDPDVESINSALGLLQTLLNTSIGNVTSQNESIVSQVDVSNIKLAILNTSKISGIRDADEKEEKAEELSKNVSQIKSIEYLNLILHLLNKPDCFTTIADLNSFIESIV